MNQEHDTPPPHEMMAFSTAVMTCFQKYADFKGRATRAEFWWFELFMFLVGAGASFLDVAFGTDSSEPGVLELLWLFATALPSLAVGARRLHDINHSGWWQLMSLTLIGIIPLLIMWCLRSAPEANRFGNPASRNSASPRNPTMNPHTPNANAQDDVPVDTRIQAAPSPGSAHRPISNAAVGAIIVGALVLAPAARTMGQVDTVDQLRYPPLPDIHIPEPTRVVLDNGMVALFLEDHELPLVHVSARIRTGSRLEPAGKVGLAGLTGTVMRSGGTTTMTGDRLDDYLESRAASIETAIGVAAGSAVMSCLREDFSDVLTIFGDVLQRPRFDPDKLAIAKNLIVAGIARQNDNPRQIMGREFAKLIYGKESPYARVASYDTINSIVRQDLVDWHAAYAHPQRIILGLVGDFSTERAMEMVKRVFGTWPRGPAVDDPDVPYQTATTRGVYFAEKHDMTQANIIIGHMGLTRKHPDYYAVVILNQILSGSFGSRLFSNIRSQKGLAYDVHGGIGFGWDVPKTARFSMSTKLETTQAGIESLLEEILKIMETAPPTEEEVNKAKASLLNSFVFSVDSPGKVLEKLLTHAYFGYPSDWLVTFRAGIERTTVQQVRQAGRTQLKPEQFVTLLVGPRAGTASALARYDTVTELNIAIPDPSL